MATKNYYSIDSYDKFFCKCDIPNPADATEFLDSATAKTITANGNATQLPIKFNKSAGFFNGTTDYVVVPHSTDFDWSGDFDIEFFANLSTVPSGAGSCVFIQRYKDGTHQWNIQFYDGNLYFNIDAGSPVVRAWSPVKNTWYHIRVRRASGQIGVYVDNSQLGVDVADSTNLTYTTAPVYIGSNQPVTSIFNGWLKELRISNIARTVAVPKTQYTSDANTVLLMHFDTPATSPLGPAITFNGTNSNLIIPTHDDFAFSGQYTVEGWFKWNATANNIFIDGGYATSKNVTFYVTGGNFLVYIEGVQSFVRSHTPVVGKWYHYAITRDASNDQRLFIDGVQQGAVVNSATSISKPTASINIGNYTSTWFNGSMREIRYSNTCRYASNFTPSQTGFTVDANTKLYIKGDENNGTTSSIWGTEYTNQANLYDGIKSLAHNAAGTSHSSYVPANTGKFWGIPRVCSSVKVYGSNNYGFDDGSAPGTGTNTITIYGSNDGSSWTDLGNAYTGANAVDESGGRTITPSSTTAYLYHKVVLATSSGYKVMTEIEFNFNDENYIKDSSTSPKTISVNGDTKIKYTEDYRSCIFKDETGKFPYPVGSAKVDFFAIGSGCAYFDGVDGSMLTLADSEDWDFGTGDFTLETYVRFKTLPSQPVMIDVGGYANGTRFVYYSNNLELYTVGNNRTLIAWVPVLNTWYHVMAARSGTSLKGAVNGTIGNSVTDSGNVQTSTGVRIGDSFDGATDEVVGLMDNIRISKGVARYTTTFNPPEFRTFIPRAILI